MSIPPPPYHTSKIAGLLFRSCLVRLSSRDLAAAIGTCICICTQPIKSPIRLLVTHGGRCRRTGSPLLSCLVSGNMTLATAQGRGDQIFARYFRHLMGWAPLSYLEGPVIFLPEALPRVGAGGKKIQGIPTDCVSKNGRKKIKMKNS